MSHIKVSYILFMPAEIGGLNPTGGMDVCLLWLLCVVRYRSLRRIDHSSRGVLPTVACRCVWSRNLEIEEAKARYRAVKVQPQWVVTPGKQTTTTTYPIYNHNWRNISTIHIYIYITILVSKEIFSPSNKIHREVGRAKDLPAPLYVFCRLLVILL